MFTKLDRGILKAYRFSHDIPDVGTYNFGNRPKINMVQYHRSSKNVP